MTETQQEPVSATCSVPALEARALGKQYGVPRARLGNGQWALRNVSFRIDPGRIVGLIGPNGAGKTTLLTLAAGIILPTEGCINVSGFAARSIMARTGLGYMPERPAFLGLYSAREVLTYHGALLGLSRSRIKEESDRLLAELELEQTGRRPAYGFSQGMKQRLSLAMALMGGPQVLILDEPSNGVDPVGVLKLRELILRLSAAGTTVIISSHRLGELERLTSDYLFLFRGQVMHTGSATVGELQVRISLLSGGAQLAVHLEKSGTVLDASSNHATLAVSSLTDVPSIVRDVVGAGYDVTEVVLQHQEDLESMFMRLYSGRK